MKRHQPRGVPAPWRPSETSEAAAAWVLLEDEGKLSDADRRRLARWLEEDEANRSAYDDALWALAITAEHAGEPSLLELRRAALGARGDRRRVWKWIGGVGAAAAMVAGLAVWVVPNADGPSPRASAVARIASDPRSSAYRTAIGERSVINLPDGSLATLDTDSQIRVAYSAGERAVYLLKGQALFEVAHGKPAPFRVYAHGQTITAVGTVFNVRLEGDRVRVAMVEGTVRVRASTAGRNGTGLAREITLTAGEAAVAAPATPLTVAPVEVREVAAWKGGQLVFNDAPLSEAVAEINRYTTRPIALSDSAIGKYRVSGVFKSNDPDRFAQAMAEILPVQVAQSTNGGLALRPTAE